MIKQETIDRINNYMNGAISLSRFSMFVDNQGLPLFSSPKIKASIDVIESKLLSPHYNPKTFKEFYENEASYLSGFEKWLETKVRFEVQVFTVVQKEWFNRKIMETNYMSDGKLYVGPVTYTALKRIGK